MWAGTLIVAIAAIVGGLVASLWPAPRSHGPGPATDDQEPQTLRLRRPARTPSQMLLEAHRIPAASRPGDATTVRRLLVAALRHPPPTPVYSRPVLVTPPTMTMPSKPPLQLPVPDQTAAFQVQRSKPYAVLKAKTAQHSLPPSLTESRALLVTNETPTPIPVRARPHPHPQTPPTGFLAPEAREAARRAMEEDWLVDEDDDISEAKTKQLSLVYNVIPQPGDKTDIIVVESNDPSNADW